MPLEVSKDVGGEWAVEIVWNGERACGKPERPGRRGGRRDGTDFRDRAAPADDNDVLSGLDSGEESRSVMGEFLRAYSTHDKSLPLGDVAGKGRAKASIPSGIQPCAPSARKSALRGRVLCGCSSGSPSSLDLIERPAVLGFPRLPAVGRPTEERHGRHARGAEEMVLLEDHLVAVLSHDPRLDQLRPESLVRGSLDRGHVRPPTDPSFERAEAIVGEQATAGWP